MVVITTFQSPESPVKLVVQNVSVLLDKTCLGLGTLFVSERTLCWQQSDNVGFCLDYYNISMHAISKDRTVHEKDCIYILTDPHIIMPGSGHGAAQPLASGEDSDADSEPDLSELVLVPERSEFVQNIYEAIKVCQELNPDPVDVDDEEENLYEDAEEHIMLEAEESDDSAVDNLAAQLEHNSVGANCRNGHNDEVFEDAD